MAKQTIVIRILQIITVVAVAGAVVLLSFNPNSPQKNTQVPDTRQKVKRTTIKAGLSYEQRIQEGTANFLSGDLESALEEFKQAAKQSPREPLAYEKIGDVYLAEHDYEQARVHFNLALQSGEPSDVLYIKLIKSLIGQRKIIDAKAIAAKLPEASIDRIYYEGLFAAFYNEREKSQELLGKSVQQTISENIRKNAQELLDVYRDFNLARDGRAEYLQVMLAQAFDHIGEYGLAIELAFDALKTEPNYRDAWIVLGHAFLNQQRFADAEDAFTRGLALDSDSAVSLFFRGIARMRIGKAQEAVTDLNQALEKGYKPRINAQYQLAQSYFDLGDMEKAFAYYQEIVIADPSDIKRFVRPIALAINQLNKPQEALVLAQKGLETHPDNAEAETLLGWALLANNNLSESRQHLEKALTLNPQLPAGYLNRGQLQERIGRGQQALDDYRKAIELAQLQHDISIEETAQQRYNALEKNANAPAESIPTLPQVNEIPTLTLE